MMGCKEWDGVTEDNSKMAILGAWENSGDMQYSNEANV